MKVFFDSQIFNLQQYGGISLYFSKLIQQFILNPNLNVQPIVDFKRFKNQHLAQVAPELCEGNSSIVSINPNKFINLATKELVNEKFDLVHFTFYLPSKYLFLNSAPMVTTIHDFTPEILYSQFSLKRRMHYLKKTYLKKSDGVIYVSNYTLNTRELIYPSLKVNLSTTIHHGVDTPSDILNDDQINFRNFYLYIGNRSSYKNFTFLIQSFFELSKELDVDLYCYGGGKPSNSELNLLRELKIAERVKFFSDSEIKLSTLLRSAIALVSPSSEEGFGFTNLEAFSYGCPVICSDINIFHEILEDLAIFFEPNSNSSLTSRMREIVGKKSTVNRNALITHSSKFSWTKCAEETSNFYHKVLSNYQK
jgi:glycosyltransferase involved in cell wall biosynthesis